MPAHVAAPEPWAELVAAIADGRLAEVIAAARDALCWRQNAHYSDAAFLERYRYCELMGPGGHSPHDTYSMGLLYLAPHTLYPGHAHPAEECYHILTHGSQWSAGGCAWQHRAAGERVLHRSGVVHAMCTVDYPLLACYLWRGDLTAPAELRN